MPNPTAKTPIKNGLLQSDLDCAGYNFLNSGGGSGLPSQAGNSGKFLTTDGSATSWAAALTTVQLGKTIWVDSVVGVNATGVRGKIDKPFLTIAGAVGASGITSGDVIRVSPGTFVENSGVILPSGVSLIGSGMDVTIIQSSRSGNANPCISTNTNSLVRDFTIAGTLTDGTFQTPIGAASSSVVGVVLINVKTTGDSDGLYMSGPNNTLSVRAFNCVFETKYDAVNMVAGGIGEFYNCIVKVTGPSTTGAGISCGVVASGTNSSYGRVRWFGGSIEVDGATTRNSIFENRGTGTNLLIEAHNVRIKRGTSASNNYDLNSNAGGAVIYYNNVTRDDGVALVTNNTCTSISGSVLKGASVGSGLTIATAKVLGRTTAGTGAVEEIGAAGVVDFLVAPSSANLRLVLTDNFISTLTEDTVPSASADFVMTYDASATTYKKVKLTNLPVSGSGNPFDQLLNTTNDVTFNTVKAGNVGSADSTAAIAFSESIATVTGALRVPSLFVQAASLGGAQYLQLTCDDVLSTGETLTLRLGGADRVATLGGNLNIANNFSTSGAFALTLTAGAITNVTLPASGTLSTLAGTETLSSKRITPRITTIVSSATPAVNVDNCDCVTITALAAAITSMTSSLTGTPTNFQKLIYRIKDNGTARAISWGASFEAGGVALPTTTVISKRLTVGFIYDSVSPRWMCVASAQEA